MTKSWMQTMTTRLCARMLAAQTGRALRSGFTLIEILMTITVAGIVIALAVPSFRYITNSNRIASEINGLLGDLQFARAEAIKEGRSVTVCVSANGTGCAATTTWQSGWIVFQDPNANAIVDVGETILRVQTPFTGTDTFQSSNGVSAITFNREGYAVGVANGTEITLHDATGNTAWTRCLDINLVGQTSTEMYNNGTCQ
jgi:type IV fimbrial biogenesis protein FimT